MSAFAVPFDLSFDAAVAYAKARGVVLAPVYYAMAAEKRAQAFTVSNLAKLDQVQAVADQLAKIHAQGGTFADFQRWAKTQDWGLPRHRLETIYRNAAQTAYMAGHWRSFEQSQDALPYLMWDAVNDSRTRPSHLALDGVIKPVGDAWWKTHNVPAGHRCRCSIRAIGREEAQRRGGITQNVPAEGGADPGWGQDPRDAFKGLLNSIENRLGKCAVGMGATLAKVRDNAPMWCKDGPVRDLLLMQKAWAERKGAMPEPRPLVLDSVPFVSAEQSFEKFMGALGADGGTVRLVIPSGDVVQVSDDLFRTLDGRWKIDKRGRDEWLLYLAAVIQSPQEVWRLKLALTEELYLMGRFQRGNKRLDALAVFKRDGDSGVWTEGKTGFVSDREKYLGDKRKELLGLSSSIRWIEM